MKRTIGIWGFVGWAIYCSTTCAVAGDSVKSQFNGWTVTITPRRTDRVVPQSLPMTTDREEPTRLEDEADLRRPNVRIVPAQQVSMQQSVPAPEPAPAPEDVLPSAESAPSPAVTATPLAPTTGQSAPRLPLIIPRARTEPLKPEVYVSQAALYRDIYFSLPFIRAEYDVNPTYRHDTTMELLFNQMRPTVIHRGSTSSNYFNINRGYNFPSGFPSGFPYTYPYEPYYPFSYGLRVHRNP
jgi:hypothetical protein